jgi:ubiquinol-cytochrome c reductase cytochrome c subunit
VKLLAVICAVSVAVVVAVSAPAQEHRDPAGRALFVQSCSSCHGADLRGVRNMGPSLRGVGAAAADFYLRTGRMPLDTPDEQPRRARSPFSDAQIRALVSYVGSFGGPGIPSVDPAHGGVSEGMRIFGENCAGCHQIQGRGGITLGAQVPTLQAASPVDVAEAVRVGPYVMPKFTFDQHELDSLARYVASTHHPDNVGGWGIGNIGPIPEGMVAWLIGALALVLVVRALGERMPR